MFSIEYTTGVARWDIRKNSSAAWVWADCWQIPTFHRGNPKSPYRCTGRLVIINWWSGVLTVQHVPWHIECLVWLRCMSVSRHFARLIIAPPLTHTHKQPRCDDRQPCNTCARVKLPRPPPLLCAAAAVRRGNRSGEGRGTGWVRPCLSAHTPSPPPPTHLRPAIWGHRCGRTCKQLRRIVLHSSYREGSGQRVPMLVSRHTDPRSALWVYE